jgi:hypothetical protein
MVEVHTYMHPDAQCVYEHNACVTYACSSSIYMYLYAVYVYEIYVYIYYIPDSQY